MVEEIKANKFALFHVLQEIACAMSYSHDGYPRIWL